MGFLQEMRTLSYLRCSTVRSRGRDLCLSTFKILPREKQEKQKNREKLKARIQIQMHRNVGKSLGIKE